MNESIAAARLAQDDQLLDGFVVGDLVGYDASPDPAVRLLAAWRAELDADLPDPLAGIDLSDFRDPTGYPADRPPAGARTAALERARRGRAAVRPRRVGRGRRMVLATGVAALATTGFVGVAMAAADAQPGSPLFGVTKVIYPGQAVNRERLAAVQEDLTEARRAAAEGRRDDARRYLDDADRHSQQIRGSDADQARRQTDQARRDLHAPATEAPRDTPPHSPVKPNPAVTPTEPTAPDPGASATPSPSAPPSPSPSAAPSAGPTNTSDGHGGDDGPPGGKAPGHDRP